MPSTKVYKDSSLLDQFEFEMGLYVTFIENALFWKSASSLEWKTDQTDATSQQISKDHMAPRELWLVKSPPKDQFAKYYIKHIFPHWILYLDGEKCDIGLYDHVPMQWKIVGLEFNEYRLELTFDSEDLIKTHTELPKPIL